MNHRIIKQIVEDAFEKAKKGSASHKLHALSKHMEMDTDGFIKYKTALRAFKKYIDNNEKIGQPIPETVKSLCKYLGYEDFKDYVEKNEKNKSKTEEPRVKKEPNLNTEEESRGKEREEKRDKNKKWILIMTIILSSMIVLFLYDYINKSNVKKENEQPLAECMVWSIDHYEKTDCDFQLHPDYGTKVEPYDASRSKMEKKKVNAATRFFSEETGQPLIWYYKTKKGTLEYFNLPGRHPVNRETLKKITEEMIEKYVSLHITKPDSFISSDTTD